jgi:alpha-L-rhamnosidase
VHGLNEVKTSFESPYGLIKSEWIKKQQKTTMHVEIPVNTKAKVYIPTGDTTKIMVNEQQLSNCPEIEIFGQEKEITVIKVGSGNYNITVSL